MIRFGFLILIFSVCWEFVSSQKPCDGILGQQFRPHPTDCRVYYLCGQGKDWRLQCGPNMIWNQEKGACVLSTPKDTCTQNIKDPLPPKPPQGDPNARTPGTRHYSPFSESTWRPKCRPGSTKRFPHPTRCAQYYDCGADPKEDWWGKHLRECRYPTLYDTRTGSCEYYSTVNCGKREMPLDPCDYLSNACRNAHCAPCHIRYATCSGLPNGVNVWRGREKTPFYVICQNERVSFHGQCTNREPGKREVYDGEYHTCGRPIDFEMGLVQHMHRGEIGKSQIVKEIHHAKQVQQSQQPKTPQRSNSPSNPVQTNKNQRNQHSNANNNAAKKPTQQANKKHINQPNNNQTPQQNVKVQNANNNQPPKQPNTPKPHINQPQNQNNQQRHTAAPSSNTAAAQNQPNAHAPHINQPKVPPPQGNANPPSKPAQTQTPGQNSQHVNQPQIQAPVHNPPPTQQQYQPPPQSHNTPQHPPNQHKPSNPQQQHNPPQRPPQNYGPPHNGPPHNQHVPQQPPQQYNHPNRQHNPPQPPQQNYGPPNRPPPQHQRPGSNVAAQPHVNQPQASAQRQGPPYNHPPNQNKVPPQNPTSLQTFIGEIQNKFMNQQSNVPQTQAHPNHSQQPRHNASPQHPSANKPSVPYQQAVRSKPRRGRRPQRKHNNQPGQPLPRQPVVHQPAPVVHKPAPVAHQPAPVAHQPPPTRQASYPHPNQQRQPSYPQAPQVKPLPPVPQRPPVVHRNGPNHSAPIPRPPLNVNRRTVQNPNIPRAGPYQNSKPPYPIPNKHHGPPQPIPTQSRIYPQPPPRARTHGPQPVQKPRIGPYPKPQLYNEPSTIRQAIGSKRGGKNLSRRRLPQPTNQVGRAFQNEPFRREVVVSDAKREKIVDIKATHIPAQQSVHSKSDRAMERYSSHILGLNEIFKSNGNQKEKQTPKEAFGHASHHKQQQESNKQQNKKQQQQNPHPNKPNYQQQQLKQQQNTVQQQLSQHQTQHSQNSPNQFPQPQSNNPGFHLNQPLQAQHLSNIAQHQHFQQQAMRQIMRVNPTQQYMNPRYQTHQNAVGNSHYLQPPTPTVLSNYFPASTARTAVLNSRFTIQSGLAASRLSQSGGPKFSNSLSNPSQFAMPNVA